MKGKVKLAMEIEESSSDVLEYGLISHPMTCSLDKLRREMCPSSLGQLIAGCESMECLRGGGWRHEEIDALGSKTRRRRQASKSTKQLGEPPSDP